MVSLPLTLKSVRQISQPIFRLSNVFCKTYALQVLAFKSDSRLWAFDKWLLAEVSYYYFSFADAYLAHILDGLRKLVQNDLDERSAKYWVDYRVEDRLAAVCSRSQRLAALCHTALRQSTLAQSV